MPLLVLRRDITLTFFQEGTGYSLNLSTIYTVVAQSMPDKFLTGFKGGRYYPNSCSRSVTDYSGNLTMTSISGLTLLA